MDDLFYVGIRDPIEVRKELLHSSKSLIDSLRRYEAFKDLKEEKLRQVLQLKHVFDELIVLNKKLRGKFPSMPIKPAPVSLARELEEARAPRAKLVPKHEKSKLDVLEEELAKVESRLGSLE